MGFFEQLKKDYAAMEGGGLTDYEDMVLDIDDIIVTEKNLYSMEGIEDLAAGIALTGLQQKLIIGLVDGANILVGGHRRRAALKLLIGEGHEEYKRVPCRRRAMTPTEYKLALLCGNAFNRVMSNYDMMMQADELKRVLADAKKEGLFALEGGKRVRDYVAEILGASPTKVAQLEAINRHATDEVKEDFKDGNIGVTLAYEQSRKPTDGEELTDDDIRAFVGRNKRHGMTRSEFLKELEGKAKSYSGTHGPDYKEKCQPKGVSINGSRVTSWAALRGRVFELYPVDQWAEEKPAEEPHPAAGPTPQAVNVSDTDTNYSMMTEDREKAAKFIASYHDFIDEKDIGTLKKIARRCENRLFLWRKQQYGDTVPERERAW